MFGGWRGTGNDMIDPCLQTVFVYRQPSRIQVWIWKRKNPG